MVKTSVKFQKNRNKTSIGGRKDRRTEGRTEGRKAKNYVPPLFFEKAGDKNTPGCKLPLLSRWSKLKLNPGHGSFAPGCILCI